MSNTVKLTLYTIICIFGIYFIYTATDFAPRANKVDVCSITARKFIITKQYSPSFQELKSILGEPTSLNKVNYSQFQWGNFSVISKDDVLVKVSGEIPRMLTKTEGMLDYSIKELMDQLGKPDSTKNLYLDQYVWRCNKNFSKIKVIVNGNNIIQSYHGEYCRKPKVELCSAFHYDYFLKF
jgi:hypothetical protein